MRLSSFVVVSGVHHHELVFRNMANKQSVDFAYRLGDCVKAPYVGPFKLRQKVPEAFPGSIGALYVNESDYLARELCLGHPGGDLKGIAKRQACYDARIAALDRVCQRHCPVMDTQVVVHLRLGDALCADTDYAKTSLRPPKAEVVCRIVSRTAKNESNSMSQLPQPARVLFISATHGGCVSQTDQYLKEIESRCSRQAGVRALAISMERGKTWHDADRHFCAMISAPKFIQGNGGYSYLAERVRTFRGMETERELAKESEYTTWLEATKEAAKDKEKEKRRNALREQNAMASQKAAEATAEIELEALLERARDVGALPDGDSGGQVGGFAASLSSDGLSVAKASDGRPLLTA